MRYRFYREHKYVSYRLFELEQLIAKTDFRSDVTTLQTQLDALKTLLERHAAHEDKAIHELLRQKGSSLHETIEADHQDHHVLFQAFAKKLEEIADMTDMQERIAQGHAFYLSYRLFVNENLRHFHIEETVLMPELQRLCSDEELKSVDANTYAQMTPEQMRHMTEILFPHMNPSDQAFFLMDIKETEPAKYAAAWGQGPEIGIQVNKAT